MTTVAQMIEWLNTLPPEAEVRCGKEITCDYHSYMEMSNVDIESCNVHDYTKGWWSPDSESDGKIIVDIRSE